MGVGAALRGRPARVGNPRTIAWALIFEVVEMWRDTLTDSPQSHSSHSEDEFERNAKPFVKWAGGKQRLLAQYEAFFPDHPARYFEPFVGGGAVFFHFWNTGRLPEGVYLFDNNRELINAYRVVRDDVDALLELLSEHKEQHSKAYYYHIRKLDRQDVELSDVERAARTIYLNKTCYNGLYRVNQKGQFNVPIGRYKNPRIRDEETLRAASAALQGVHVEARDFRTVVELAQAGDFFYFDPPYDPLSKTANFTSYTAGDFDDDDQRDLARVFTRLTEKGCLCMLSNSYTEFIRDLYKEFTIKTVSASRAISSDPNGRGSVQEVVVLNYSVQIQDDKK
jgi:DNA adenine methylase